MQTRMRSATSCTVSGWSRAHWRPACTTSLRAVASTSTRTPGSPSTARPGTRMGVYGSSEATMMVLPDVPAVIGGSHFIYDLIQGGYCYDFVFSPPGEYRVTGMHP